MVRDDFKAQGSCCSCILFEIIHIFINVHYAVSLSSFAIPINGIFFETLLKCHETSSNKRAHHLCHYLLMSHVEKWKGPTLKFLQLVSLCIEIWREIVSIKSESGAICFSLRTSSKSPSLPCNQFPNKIDIIPGAFASRIASQTNYIKNNVGRC